MRERFAARWSRLRNAKRATHPAYMRYFFVSPDLVATKLADQREMSAGLVGRLADHYTAGQAAEAMRTPSMWDRAEAGRQEFLAPILGGDTGAASGAFRNLFDGSVLDGMSHGNSLFANEGRNPYERGFVARRSLDCLLSLAEAMGVAPLPSWGQRRIEYHARDLLTDPAPLLAPTEEAVGFDLSMPATGSPTVVRLADRPVAPDSLRHAYVAWRARQLAGPDAPVVEIGGGYGMLALLGRRAGLGDWTIIDLPFVGCIQYGYLAGALDENAVASTCEERHAPITIAKPEDIYDLPDDAAGLVVNCDSLPEMGPDTAKSYLREIQRIAPLFLSINQEAGTPYHGVPQGNVGRMISEIGGYRRVYRFRHWMEQGYAEELYERA